MPTCPKKPTLSEYTRNSSSFWSDVLNLVIFSLALLSELERHPWPGNIRELQNACERAVLLAGDGQLSADHFLLGSLLKIESSVDTDLVLRSGLSVAEVEKRLIFETLKATGNNKTRAAELLGISIRTLRNKLHEYGVGEALTD